MEADALASTPLADSMLTSNGMGEDGRASGRMELHLVWMSPIARMDGAVVLLCDFPHQTHGWRPFRNWDETPVASNDFPLRWAAVRIPIRRSTLCFFCNVIGSCGTTELGPELP